MFRKIILSITAALFAISAQAQISPPGANDIMLTVARGDGTFQSRYIETDKTGALQFLMFGQDPTPGAPVGQLRPQKRIFGPSIVCGTLTGSTCDVVASGMTVYAAQVQDSTAVGRSVMTAADATAARMAIGAGTSSFDGAYAGLSGVPATFAPSMHTHPLSQISDATSAGRAILTAADASAMRSLLGVQSASEAQAMFYPQSSNPAGYLTSAALSPYLTTVAANTAYFAKPTGNTAQYLRGDGSLATLPATSARVFSNPARPLNTAFQISTTRDVSVVYTVDISVTSVLLAGASGRVHLEYADDSAFTANVVTVNSSPNATGGVLNVTNLGVGNVSGWIPAGKYVRIRTQNVTQTPTFTFQISQEVLQ